MKRFVFRFICIVLLLAGQQAGLTHALAHAQDRISRTAGAHAGDSNGSAQKKTGERFALCDFDYAYTQVLGAVHCASMPALKVDASFHAAPAVNPGHDTSTAPPFLIRGPPRLL